jgi:hypothetical protein
MPKEPLLYLSKCPHFPKVSYFLMYLFNQHFPFYRPRYHQILEEQGIFQPMVFHHPLLSPVYVGNVIKSSPLMSNIIDTLSSSIPFVLTDHFHIVPLSPNFCPFVCFWFHLPWFELQECCNSTLKECEDKTHTPKMGTWSPSQLLKLQSSIARVKTPCIGMFFISLESYQSVDIENGLVCGIWTSIAHVMAKRKAKSQIGNLIPNH